MTTVAFDVNGSRVEATRSARRLSDVLRDDLGLTATKVGCDAGDCGACTVLLDGEPVSACMVPVGRLVGRRVQTLEGLDASGDIAGLQRSFLQHGAAQCGICTPGMLVSAAALLRESPAPSEQQVMDALGGVLCRCTGYRKIVAAVMGATSRSPSPRSRRRRSARQSGGGCRASTGSRRSTAPTCSAPTRRPTEC